MFKRSSLKHVQPKLVNTGTNTTRPGLGGYTDGPRKATLAVSYGRIWLDPLVGWVDRDSSASHNFYLRNLDHGFIARFGSATTAHHGETCLSPCPNWAISQELVHQGPSSCNELSDDVVDHLWLLLDVTITLDFSRAFTKWQCAQCRCGQGEVD